MISFIFWLLIGTITTFIFEKIILSNKKLKGLWDNPKTVFGYHFHHSLLGLILSLAGIAIFLFGSLWGISLAGFGLGIVLVHTYTDKRLIFIEKAKHSYPNN